MEALAPLAPLVELVPNFSEGRDAAVIEALTRTARAAGVYVLGVESDADHNRSVLTLAGGPDAVVAAAVDLAGEAARHIDLTRHRGVHPRLGATDVLPFVPLAGISLAGCAALAHAAGARIWERHRIPVYFYEAAARRPERRKLEDVRRGEFEGIRARLPGATDFRPDIGDAVLHPTAGAVIVGARPFLIAYNFNLTTRDLAVARAIARRIRASSGGLPGVKALGLWVPHLDCAQVSTNLTDFVRTPLRVLQAAVQAEAERRGAAVREGELIGLLPQAAVVDVPQDLAAYLAEHPERIIEERLAVCRQGTGASGSVTMRTL